MHRRANATGDLDVTGDLVIEGARVNGEAGVILANNIDRALDVHAGPSNFATFGSRSALLVTAQVAPRVRQTYLTAASSGAALTSTLVEV